MEEDIKVLEDTINELKGNISMTNTNDRKIQAIENLIARNKELEERKKKNYISKDKIREKIEEIDEILDRNLLVDKLRVYFTAKKEVLEELLQEGDK